MSAVNQLTRLSVLTATVVVTVTPAMARPFIEIKFKHILPVASLDLGHGRSLDIGGGGPLGVPSVHVTNDKGFIGGMINTVDDTIHLPATALKSTIGFFQDASNFFKGPDRINDTIRHGFDQFPQLVEQFFLLIKPYLLTLSIGLPLSIVIGFLLLGLLLRQRSPVAG